MLIPPITPDNGLAVLAHPRMISPCCEGICGENEEHYCNIGKCVPAAQAKCSDCVCQSPHYPNARAGALAGDLLNALTGQPGWRGQGPALCALIRLPPSTMAPGHVKSLTGGKFSYRSPTVKPGRGVLTL